LINTEWSHNDQKKPPNMPRVEALDITLGPWILFMNLLKEILKVYEADDVDNADAMDTMKTINEAIAEHNITLEALKVYMSAQSEKWDGILEDEDKEIYYGLFYLICSFSSIIKYKLTSFVEIGSDYVNESIITENRHLQMCDAMKTTHRILDWFDDDEKTLSIKLKDGVIIWKDGQGHFLKDAKEIVEEAITL